MKTVNKKTLSKYGFIFSMLIYPTVLFIIFYVFININSFILAFQDMTFDGVKSFAGFENFAAFFRELGSGKSNIIYRSVINSLKMYFINLVICMPLYIAFSYYLFRKWTGHQWIRIIVMLPAIISGFVMCLLFKKFVEIAIPAVMGRSFPNLLTDERYTFGTSLFYMIWTSFSTSLIVYTNAMKEIDGEILEAAKIDGANMWQELFRIIIPLIFPTLTTFLVLGVAGIFSNAGPIVAFYEFSAPAEVYNVGYYLTQRTMRVGLDGYPELAAIGVILTLVMAPVTIGVKTLLEKFGPEAD